MVNQKYPLISDEEKQEWKDYRRHLGRMMADLRYKKKRGNFSKADECSLWIVSNYHKMLGIYLKGDIESYLLTHDNNYSDAQKIRTYAGMTARLLKLLELLNPEDDLDQKVFEIKRLSLMEDITEEEKAKYRK